MKSQYYTATSLDGFLANEDDSIEWLFPLGDLKSLDRGRGRARGSVPRCRAPDGSDHHGGFRYAGPRQAAVPSPGDESAVETGIRSPDRFGARRASLRAAGTARRGVNRRKAGVLTPRENDVPGCGLRSPPAP